ncbi:hypothetical protein M5689_021520 [Euphorbia peplus]|nr:hypothetical protein M5689_021520 [Euphorbia peplus]
MVESQKDIIEKWEEARCPICFEHPHNAVMLNCSSFDKGCQPFMCNTSSRHSNCYEQFHKSAKAKQLACPLCRGQISGWSVVEPAREFMNSKTRTCSTEACDFAGNYMELRKHARSKHPTVKPSAVDSERQRKWARLERESNRFDLQGMLPPIGSPDEDEIVIYDAMETEEYYNNNLGLVADHNHDNNVGMLDDILCLNSEVQCEDCLMMVRRTEYVRVNLIPRGNGAYIIRARNGALRRNNTRRRRDTRFNPAAHNHNWRNV